MKLIIKSKQTKTPTEVERDNYLAPNLIILHSSIVEEITVAIYFKWYPDTEILMLSVDFLKLMVLKLWSMTTSNHKKCLIQGDLVLCLPAKMHCKTAKNPFKYLTLPLQR